MSESLKILTHHLSSGNHNQHPRSNRCWSWWLQPRCSVTTWPEKFSWCDQASYTYSIEELLPLFVSRVELVSSSSELESSFFALRFPLKFFFCLVSNTPASSSLTETLVICLASVLPVFILGENQQGEALFPAMRRPDLMSFTQRLKMLALGGKKKNLNRLNNSCTPSKNLNRNLSTGDKSVQKFCTTKLLTDN